MPSKRIASLVASLILVACTSPAENVPAPEVSASTPEVSPARDVPSDTVRAEITAQAGEMCGGIAGITCDEGLYCSMPVGDCIHIADASGVCAEKPLICTMEMNPVCGCDGKTYSNACGANANGVSVASAGACAEQG